MTDRCGSQSWYSLLSHMSWRTGYLSRYTDFARQTLFRRRTDPISSYERYIPTRLSPPLRPPSSYHRRSIGWTSAIKRLFECSAVTLNCCPTRLVSFPPTSLESSLTAVASRRKTASQKKGCLSSLAVPHSTHHLFFDRPNSSNPRRDLSSLVVSYPAVEERLDVRCRLFAHSRRSAAASWSMYGRRCDELESG